MSKWFWHLDGCYTKGFKAHQHGKPIESCPYQGHRGLNRQRREYWQQGWKSAANEAKGNT